MRLVIAPWRTAPVLPHAGPLLLCIARDGWASTGTGEDKWLFPRWAVCPSADGKAPLRRYRNGGPVGLDRPVSGKVAPLWADRAVRFVGSCGGLPMAALGPAVAWFRKHKSGAPDLGLVATWGEA